MGGAIVETNNLTLEDLYVLEGYLTDEWKKMPRAFVIGLNNVQTMHET